MLKPKSKSSSRIGSGFSLKPEKRQQMIAEAAYFRAERRSFGSGDMLTDWVEAEAEIDRMLGTAPGGSSAPSPKDSFQQWMEIQLKELDDKIEEFNSQAPEIKGKIRTEVNKQLKVLAEKRATAREKLQELRLRTEDAWDDLKVGTENVLGEMQEAMERIAARFK